MKMSVTRCAMVLPLLLGASACVLDDVDVDEEDIGTSEQASTSTNGMSLNGMSLNGMSLNGMSLNGMSLNGMSLNGMSLNGMSLNGMSLNGMSLNGMSLNGSQLTGVTSSGQTLSGAGLVGARLNGIISNGASLPMRVDSAAILPAPNADVWGYAVSYRVDDGIWRSLCGTSAGAPVLAIPLAGTWNYGVGATGGAWSSTPGTFTFACRGTALSKCVELGYKPWKTVSGTSLRNHHQTCTRMLRADYCGNGQPGTLNGWQVNLYDKIGVQADTENGATWVFEAEWSSSGAVCVDEYRALELVVAGDLPTCALEKVTGTCGSIGFPTGVLIKSEYNSSGVEGLVAQLVNQNPGTPLADKVEDALASIENGFAELALSPPDREQAVAYFESASGDLQAAVKDGLLPAGYGNGLLNRIAGLSRHQTTSAIGDNACFGKNKPKLVEAKAYLAQGDTHRAAGRYKDANSKYRVAIAAAKATDGKPCAVK